MLTLNDGRSELWQWDTGRTLAVDADCSQVHFSNKVFGRSIDVDVVGGAAIIPDVLLQTDKDLNVWAFVGTAENGYTKISKIFTVNRRNKPADYVFTPADQITLHTIQSQIGDLSDLTTEAKGTLVAAINEAAQTGGGGGSTVELDTTLTQSGKAADAKAVGDALAGKQDTISDLEAIRSGAANGATALQAVPSTYRTATAQDAIDNGLSDRVSAIEGKEAGWDAKSNFSGNYNDLTNKPTIPTALPNPNALTFTGAVTGSYDGSAPMSVNIPQGGGGTGGGSSGTWELIGEVTSDGAGTNSGISIPCDISGYKSVFVYAQNLPSDTNFRIVMRTTLTWTGAACFFGYNLLGKQGSATFVAQSGKMNNLWSMTGLAYNVANHIFSYGAAESQYNGGTAPWRQGEQSNKLPNENWANVKYISLDRNSSTDIVPEGCILRAWGCK